MAILAPRLLFTMSLGIRQQRGFGRRTNVVRNTCNSRYWLSFNISIGNRQRKGFELRVIGLRYWCNSEDLPELHVDNSTDSQAKAIPQPPHPATQPCGQVPCQLREHGAAGPCVLRAGEEDPAGSGPFRVHPRELPCSGIPRGQAGYRQIGSNLRCNTRGRSIGHGF